MASSDEYQQKQFFERKLKWCSSKDLLPNPKTYLYTGTSEPSDILWYEEKFEPRYRFSGQKIPDDLMDKFRNFNLKQ